MNKGKTLLDFFTRSPASNSSPNGSLSKSETAKTDQNGTPKSTKNLSSKTPNKSGKLSSGLAFSNKISKTPTSTKKCGSATKRSPGGKRKPSEDQENIENESTDNKNCSVNDLSEDEENEAQPPKSKNAKRRRIVVASESEDSDDYVPEKCSESSDSEAEPDNNSESDDETPKKRKKTSKNSTPSLQAFSNKKKSNGNSSIVKASPKNASFNSASSPITISKQKSSDIQDGKGSNLDSVVKEYFHEKIDWLQPNKIRDKSGKHASDPKYNPTTLFVPENFLNKTTPAMRQWWELKSEHFDTVLFFKVGKFYELYHMDAAIGVKELGLIYMKGDFAHSGFPESAFGKYSESLIEKGYKVARVEQTESPEEMTLRCKKMSRPSKYDKVVSREICQITTKGTRTLTYQEENMSVTNNFLLAICEKSVNDADSLTEYGICFVDTSVGKFWLGQFKDDRYRSRLLTLIALHPIVEVLYDKLYIKKQTLRLLDNNLSGVRREALNSSSQFWEPSKVLQFLRKSGYFNNSDGELEFPQSLMKMLDSDDLLLQTPLKQYEFALRSLGACVWYLKECHIEDCLLSMKLFEEYIPSDGAQCVLSKFSDSQKNMVLDSVTLKNLEIVPVSSDNNEGTLLGTMDNCSTSFGKRLFRSWLCSPLYNPKDISERLDAIEDLMELPDLVQTATTLLSSLPDLERLLSKIHTFGFARSKSHPDSRATFYNSEVYNKRKIIDFLSTLQGFKTVVEIVSLFKQHSDAFKSPLLKYCTSFTSDSGHFPHVLEQLEYFDKAFDHEMAKSKGCIIPGPGIDAEYDKANSDMEKALKDLELFLNKQKKSLGCKASYVHSGKNRYLLEIPDTIKVPSGFDCQGGRKGFKRFYTEEIKELLADLIKSEESRNAALEDISRRIFAKFDSDYEKWKTALQCISTLDALISLTRYSQSSTDMCRPTFRVPSENEQPFLSISDGRHPTFLTYTKGDDYIPNSVYIGPKKETETDQINRGGTIVLVTGPNMGGKSTLMRQAGTLVIMAHLGSYVPASSMSLTPVDRIFTRVGAMDHLSKGESTFFVEASETSSILHHATSNSFVLVDELGRGTATYDGTAIANATLKYLANNIKCRTLFSTHYHSLVNDFSDHPNVGLGHMACMEENDEECSSLEKITFLYKFINGACPKSYGFNCALLAGVPKPIVEFGFFKAQQVECSTKIFRSLRKLFASHSPEKVINVLATKLNFLEEAKN